MRRWSYCLLFFSSCFSCLLPWLPCQDGPYPSGSISQKSTLFLLTYFQQGSAIRVTERWLRGISIRHRSSTKTRFIVPSPDSWTVFMSHCAWGGRAGSGITCWLNFHTDTISNSEFAHQWSGVLVANVFIITYSLIICNFSNKTFWNEFSMRHIKHSLKNNNCVQLGSGMIAVNTREGGRGFLEIYIYITSKRYPKLTFCQGKKWNYKCWCIRIFSWK